MIPAGKAAADKNISQGESACYCYYEVLYEGMFIEKRSHFYEAQTPPSEHLYTSLSPFNVIF